MQTKEYSSLGLKVNISVPSTVEEFDQNAKRTGACLDEAINNTVYRGVLADFREKFCEALETHTAIPRHTKDSGKKDSDGNAIMLYTESEGDYPKRAAAEQGVEVATYQHIADAVAAELVFDASARERKAPTPKKLPDWAKKVAEEFLSGAKSLEKLSAAFAKIVGTPLTVSGETHEDKVKSLAASAVAFKAANDVFSKM
jgi:hypothetical protein